MRDALFGAASLWVPLTLSLSIAGFGFTLGRITR